MRVIVYVEGPSDKGALESLLEEFIRRKSSEGVRITFHESPIGNKKLTLLEKVPIKAVDILRSQPNTVVVALPDLYPKNIGFPHETYEELRDGMIGNFRKALRDKDIQDDRFLDCFHVFCFKHDLEVLLLAAKEGLLKRLNASKLKVEWREPVEEQNHGRPPKEVIKELFSAHGKLYDQTVDAPQILTEAKLDHLTERCPQCFKPFIDFLENLTPATSS